MGVFFPLTLYLDVHKFEDWGWSSGAVDRVSSVELVIYHLEVETHASIYDCGPLRHPLP